MRALVTLVLLLSAGPLCACCMVPEDYAGDVDQSAQQGVIIHRAPTDGTPGYEELMLRVVPYFHEADDNPESLAWIVTLPSKPMRYDVAEQGALRAGPDLHEALYQLAREQWANRTQFEWPEALTWMDKDRGQKGAADPALEVQPEFKVGPYTITEVKATGVAALNDYLDENGFPREDPGHLQYFIDNDFTFLCIHITPPEAGELGRTLDLDPLLIGFETDRPYYPAKFSSRQGNFALDLTLITDTPLKSIPLERTRFRLKAERRGYVHLLNLWSVQALPEDLSGVFSERATEQPAMWYVNRIESFGFNEPDENGQPAIAAWEDDIFFELGDYNDSIAGFWYYGDSDVTVAEKFFREHALAIMVFVAVFLFGGLYIKTHINRKRLKQEP